MTLNTMYFENHKKNGNIIKAGKAGFSNGLRYEYRTLWKNNADGKLYVMLNREAYEFTPYKKQPEDDLVIGRI